MNMFNFFKSRKGSDKSNILNKNEITKNESSLDVTSNQVPTMLPRLRINNKMTNKRRIAIYINKN